MALIKCSECGREISDKATACPGCGCPVRINTISNKQTAIEKLVDEIYNKNDNMYVAIKELREKTGLDLKTADNIMRMKYKGLTLEEEHKILKNQMKEKRRKNNENLCNSLQAISNLSSSSKTPHCPKCRSTSISYDTKKLSIGRAIVGDAIAGAPGAVIGGLSSKKGYAVCLNCGKRWKI